MLYTIFFLCLINSQANIEVSVDVPENPKNFIVRQMGAQWGKIIVEYPNANLRAKESQSFFPQRTDALKIPIPRDRSGNLPREAEVHEIQTIYKPVRKAGSFGTGPGQMRAPVSISADPFDHIYVVDSSDDRILKFSRDLRFLQEYGSFNMDTSSSFEDDFSSIEEGQFDGAWDLAAGPNLTFFVSDRNNHRLVELDLQGRFVREILPQDSFDEPTAMEMNARNELAVLDSQNERVLFFNTFGQIIYSIGGYGRTKDHLQRPLDLVFNNQNELAVLDLGLPGVKLFSVDSRFKESKLLGNQPRAISKDSLGYLIIHFKDTLQFLTPDLKAVPLPFEEDVNLKGILDITFTSNQHLYALRDDPVQIIEFAPVLSIDKKIVKLSSFEQ